MFLIIPTSSYPRSVILFVYMYITYNEIFNWHMLGTKNLNTLLSRGRLYEARIAYPSDKS